MGEARDVPAAPSRRRHVRLYAYDGWSQHVNERDRDDETLGELLRRDELIPVYSTGLGLEVIAIEECDPIVGNGAEAGARRERVHLSDHLGMRRIGVIASDRVRTDLDVDHRTMTLPVARAHDSRLLGVSFVARELISGGRRGKRPASALGVNRNGNYGDDARQLRGPSHGAPPLPHTASSR